jgi:hypothetical protein
LLNRIGKQNWVTLAIREQGMRKKAATGFGKWPEPFSSFSDCGDNRIFNSGGDSHNLLRTPNERHRVFRNCSAAL